MSNLASTLRFGGVDMATSGRRRRRVRRSPAPTTRSSSRWLSYRDLRQLDPAVHVISPGNSTGHLAQALRGFDPDHVISAHQADPVDYLSQPVVNILGPQASSNFCLRAATDEAVTATAEVMTKNADSMGVQAQG